MTELLQALEWSCAEIHTTETKVEIEVETPGREANDLSIEVDGHRLTVFGAQATGEPDSGFTFELPAEANLDRLHAAFDDGVLTVIAPLSSWRHKRTVEIETPHLIHGEACGS